MAKRPNQNDDGGQLNLFSINQNRYDSNHTDPILLEAEEKTASEMHDLTMQLQRQGLSAQQAHNRAWEIVREKYILLTPESE